MRLMSFWTSFSSNLRPMRRFTAKMVFLALVTAWRLAGAPTRISSLSVYATIEGVVREPSLFSMTLGLPPSMMATHEFVVPRSMPMIFAMSVFLGVRKACVVVWKVGLFRADSSGLLGDHDQRRAQNPVMQEVALLQDGHHGIRFRVALDLPDGLVPVGVEFLALGGDLADGKFFEHAVELLRGDLHALLEGLDGGVLDGKGRIQAVLHR